MGPRSARGKEAPIPLVQTDGPELSRDDGETDSLLPPKSVSLPNGDDHLTNHNRR